MGSSNDVHAAGLAEIAPERDAGARLATVNGSAELQAVLLAMLIPAGSKRALRAWQIETAAMPGADVLREHAASLSGAARLPWFERLLARMGYQPLPARQELLKAARRLMGARGVARPIDRLHWLAMRRGCGEIAPLAARPEANVEVAEWLESDVLDVAAYTAFLSRMVPGVLADSTEGQAWYEAVMTTWQPFADVPAWQPPNAAGMVDALGHLQTLSWMQRPGVVRNWVTTAIRMSPNGRLTDLSADALRLTCGLLDSPLPPELSRHYITVADETPK
ncbi:MAG: hypothetical protein ABI143_10550 [Caldimonas sp.]